MAWTLSDPVRHEALIRKSRFLALAAPVAAPEDVQEFLDARRDHQATHNCWAWRLGAQYRFHDDGEPGGTAGRPILQAIESQDCDRVVVLVIRWFGGIKLGTGGLARAYGGTAAECLRLADKVILREERQVRCSCPYPDMERLQARLQAAGVRIEAADFDAAGVVWLLRVAVADLPEVRALHADQTGGQGRWQELESH